MQVVVHNNDDDNNNYYYTTALRTSTSEGSFLCVKRNQPPTPALVSPQDAGPTRTWVLIVMTEHCPAE